VIKCTDLLIRNRLRLAESV